MINYPDFEEVFIENSIREHYKTKLILSRLNPGYNIVYFDDIHKLIKDHPPVYHPLDRSRKLVLSKIRGEVIRKCPGTHGHICCNYHVINQYIGCPINCSYCILQGYLNQPFTIINVDIEVILNELNINMKENPGAILRIGTGELGDSLVYDLLTDFSLDFIDFFSKNDGILFEFKTKTNTIENLLRHENPGNIIVGFSMNPDSLTKGNESRAATIDERIDAMKKLIAKGYKISLHFDPILNIPNFAEKYQTLINKIFKVVPTDSIAWISMGTFRYTNELKNMIEYNYQDTFLLSDEFVLTKDSKFRYFRPVRTKLYKAVLKALHDVDLGLPVYLCMESPEVWQDVLGTTPGCLAQMDFLFKRRGHYEKEKNIYNCR